MIFAREPCVLVSCRESCDSELALCSVYRSGSPSTTPDGHNVFPNSPLKPLADNYSPFPASYPTSRPFSYILFTPGRPPPTISCRPSLTPSQAAHRPCLSWAAHYCLLPRPPTTHALLGCLQRVFRWDTTPPSPTVHHPLTHITHQAAQHPFAPTLYSPSGRSHTGSPTGYPASS